MPVRFDAYTATTDELTHDAAVMLLVQAGGPANVTLHQGRGFHQFGERIAVKGYHGDEIGAVQWGGKHGNLVMLEAKGTVTPDVVQLVREYPHRCTRVDSCADFDSPAVFRKLYRQCRAVKKAHRIMGGKAGDWEDFPEKGRTLYLGAKSSTTRARLYEKGLQPEYEHLKRPDWVRLEVQVRPKREARYEYSQLSAAAVWGASRWTRDLAATILKNHVDPHPAGTVYRQTSDERALNFMCRQYGAHLMRLYGDLGDWESVGLTLSEIIKAQLES